MKYIKTFLLALSVSAACNTLTAQINEHKSSQWTNDEKNNFNKTGNFINVKAAGGGSYSFYATGPEDAKSAIILVHDYFGISNATKKSAEYLATLGYRVYAVDLYKGKTAVTHDSALKLLQKVDTNETKRILQCAIDNLKRPGRKLASIGFSAGGIDAMRANLLDPESFSATIIVYGGGYDKIPQENLATLKSPFLAITGALDNWPKEAALNFLQNEKNKLFELYIYPAADHGYAQPLFNEGKNYNAEATRVTWLIMEDFLMRNLQ